MSWGKTIKELEDFFAKEELPTMIRLNKHENIVMPKMFVDSHFQMIKANIGKETFKPYVRRLIELKELLTKTKSNVNKEKR